MDWERVLPRIQHSLTPLGRLAIVFGRGFRNEPWAGEMGELITCYSTNREYERYDLLQEARRTQAVCAGRADADASYPLFTNAGRIYRVFYSRNGLSRERMGLNADAFDAHLKAIIAHYQPGPVLEFELTASLVWGRPAEG